MYPPEAPGTDFFLFRMSSDPTGGRASKKGSGPAKVRHTKPSELQNISNGIQRLQLSTPPPVVHHKDPTNHPKGKQPHGAAGRHHGVKQGTDVFAMKKEFYAGAGFDLSPDVGSLPIPKLNKEASSPCQQPSPAVEEVRRPISLDELLGTSSACVTEESRLPNTQVPGTPMTEVDRLRLKSQQLMRILSAGGGSQKPADSSSITPVRTADGRPISTQQLEDMTAEVRKLLNL